ncbi:putative monogalactosyldiacylglycerol synthase [Firmicutes bacterium CAG:884]|nr:glycosyltransferase [Bacillota bacterium]CCY94760.1 putative monogalactosyldiacylglycerol synthase [Firmicutes bacterium CAG:884]
MKILIISCSTGGGHNACAKYILEELKNNNIEAEFKDFYDIVNKKAKKLSEKLYLSTLNGNGKIFKVVYKLGELYSKTKLKSPVYSVNKLHKKKLYNYIIQNKIDLVITTHIFPALTLTAIKKVPFLLVATDYTACPFMEEANPNYYVIQNGIEKDFINKGIDEKKLLKTGIPVSSNFIKNAKNIRYNLNIDKEKTILIMLGSMGFGNINKIVNNLLEIDNTKIIIVTGSNKELYNKLKKIKNKKLITLGYVHNMNDLIYSSDIVVSKPGGLSSTEIASINKPLIHAFAIPGIETINTNFFYNHKMSIKCNNENEIIQNIIKLLNDNKLQKEMIKSQSKIINKNSASDLVKFIKSNFDK